MPSPPLADELRASVQGGGAARAERFRRQAVRWNWIKRLTLVFLIVMFLRTVAATTGVLVITTGWIVGGLMAIVFSSSCGAVAVYRTLVARGQPPATASVVAALSLIDLPGLGLPLLLCQAPPVRRPMRRPDRPADRPIKG